MNKAIDVANYILCLNDDSVGDLISNLKLQKLLFYSQGFSLVINERPLFEEEIRAWTHGPVVPVIYQAFKSYERGAIPRPESFDSNVISKEDRDLINEVYDTYGQFSAWRLRDLTHEKGTPWEITKNRTGLNSVIPLDLMKEYFTTLVNKE